MAMTMKDVAERAGVAVITVSRVINGNSFVHEETKAKVRAAISELNYIPNSAARSLRSRQTATLALVVPDITNPFWTTLARGVEDAAGMSGFTVFLSNTDEDPEKEARYLTMLMERRVDGLLIGPTPGSQRLLQHIARQNVRFVVVDRQVEGIQADVVRADTRGGAAALTQHLLLTGKRRIAYIGGPLATSTGRDRYAGYRGALLSMNVDVDPRLVKCGEFRAESGEQLTAELLASGVQADAILAGNNQIALGVLRALAAARITIPADIAVASIDDIVGLNSFGPFLTAVIQPAYEIGRLGTRVLLDKINGRSEQVEELILPTQLVIGASCGCMPMPSVAPAALVAA
ncbi:MAG: LacI family transcriptional regulator [Chloroflexota bacterium]|nr:LacI family transcriptional regulator [Chloroflexota bacterium]